MLPAVSFTNQPQDATVATNGNTSFSVSATGSGTLTYQWQVDNGSGFSNVSDGVIYGNTTTATLNITGASLEMNGFLYRCVVTGCSSTNSNSATLTVNKLAQTLTFSSQSNGSTVHATYGDAAIDASANSSASLTPSYTSSNTNIATISTTGQITITGTGSTTITATQAGNETYSPATTLSFTLQVAARPLNIAADAQTKVYGTSDPALTYTISSGSLLNSDALTGTLTRQTGENAGPYTINQGSLSAGNNYTINYTSNTLTITRAPQTITWSQDLTTGCNGAVSPITLTATATSGLPITYETSDTRIATIDDTNLTAVHPGSTTITATQTGDQNHLPATAVTNNFNYLLSGSVTQRSNYVLQFNNTDENYQQWQWFKNGNPLTGATASSYNELDGLNGTYYVGATNSDNITAQTCPITIATSGGQTGGIKLLPNPSAPGSVATVICNYSLADLQQSRLVMIDMAGKVVRQIEGAQPITQITLPASAGVYIVTLIRYNGKKSTCKALIVNP
jgi:hypothetical protein